MQTDKEEEGAKAAMEVVKAEDATIGNGDVKEGETELDRDEAKCGTALKQNGKDKQGEEEEQEEGTKEEAKKEDAKEEAKEEEAKKAEGKKELKEKLPEKPVLQLHGKQSLSGKLPTVSSGLHVLHTLCTAFVYNAACILAFAECN